MSERFLDPNQEVGYDYEHKKLIVCLSDKMAAKMAADGWDIKVEREVGHFIVLEMES